MKMNKRSQAELRKLRKREKILVEAMAEVKAWNDEELHDYSLGELVDGCIAELAEVNKKEDFLRKLDTPDTDPTADEILNKIRNRAGIVSAAQSMHRPSRPKKAKLTLADRLLGVFNDDE